MKKIIVITSIFDPTDAVLSFANLKDYQLIVVGDVKTNVNWYCKGVEYLSLERQQQTGVYLNKLLPYNHYCRKMMGYLYAMIKDADLIIDSDDDNIPKKHFVFPDFEGIYSFIPPDNGFVNIYQFYSEQHIWPRGLPLSFVTRKFDFEKEKQMQHSKIGVWQSLADENPDVDAIYRLTNNASCVFKECEPIVLGKNTISPFNSQNTAIRKELFQLLYLPAYVGFRFTDILRGLIAQPIMWLYGYHLGFTGATVIQKRNPHNYFEDFLSEIPMYQHVENIINIVNDVISEKESVNNNLFKAYVALVKKNIVPSDELITLEAWLKDIEKI